jgi:hypothetical protein
MSSQDWNPSLPPDWNEEDETKRSTNSPPESAPPESALPPRPLSQLELDVQAKQQAAADKTSFTTLEQDVMAKQQQHRVDHGRPGAYSMASPAKSVPMSGPRELSLLEQDVAAKQCSTSSFAPPAALSQLEEVNIKAAAARPASFVSSLPGAYAEAGGRAHLSMLENDITAKQLLDVGGSPAAASLSRLELDIATKTTAAARPPRLPDDDDEVCTSAPGAYAAPFQRGTKTRGLENEHAALSQLEQQVASKTMSNSLPSDLAMLEDAVLNLHASPTRSMKLSVPPVVYSSNTPEEKKSDQVVVPPPLPPPVMMNHIGKSPIPSGSSAPTSTTSTSSYYSHAFPQEPPLEQHHQQQPVVQQYISMDDAGLAIAMAVEEDPEDMFIPNAVEYDPDAKPAAAVASTRKCLKLAVAIFGLVLVVIVVMTSVLVTKKDDSPTMAPTTERETMGLYSVMEGLVGTDVLEDASSFERQALDWLTRNDTLVADLSEDALIQRYGAAYFYMATSVNEPWRSCNPPLANETAECTFEKYLPTPSGDPSFNKLQAKRWLSNTSECEWGGVLCDDNGILQSIELGK